MKFKLEIEMDNSTFQHDPGDEIRYILSEINFSLINEYAFNKSFKPDKINLRDSNGNTVGHMKVIGKCKS